MSKISIFKNCKALKPFATLSLSEIVKNTKQGIWKDQIETLRSSKNERRQKSLKKSLPALTLCGESNGRDIVKPSGYIGIDVDSKHHEENILEKFSALCQDIYVHAAWISSRGLGLRLVFKINPAKHEESFLGIEKYLYEKYSLTVDDDCKDVKRLSFVSYHEGAYMGYKKKVFRKLVKVQKIPESIASIAPVISYKEVKERVDLIVKAGKDITEKRQNWIAIGLLCAEVGDKGRALFHEVSKFYSGYSAQETDSKFNDLSKGIQRRANTQKKKVTTATLDFLMRQYGIIKLNGKMKLNLSKGEEDKTTQTIYASDMDAEAGGIFLYGLLEFKVFKKDKFKCSGLNTERVTEWLHKNGYNVFDKTYYHIEKNIVEVVPMTKIHNDVYTKGVLEKLPKGIQFLFDANGEAISRNMVLDAALKNSKKILDTTSFPAKFNPDDQTRFLKDTRTEIYLKYSDTVEKITHDKKELLPYANVPGLVWKNSIRQFKRTTSNKKSVVQSILDKAIGEEHREAYMRAVGFMISNFLPPEDNAILFCCDLTMIEGLNNGGNGKDFIRQILQQVREVVLIPAMHIDLKKEFALAWADRDTEIIWFEDLNRSVKMNQFYNFSNGVPIRRLNTQPFFVSAKIGVSLQYAIDIEGTSNKRRQIFLLFKNYFSLLPKGIASEFGSIFATDWPDAERAAFNNFISDCCQQYLKFGLKQMPIDALIEARKEALEGDMYSRLEVGKRYSVAEAMEYLQRQGYEIRTTDPKYFLKNWAAYCDLSGKYIDPSYRTSTTRYYTMLNGSAPMKLTKGGKAVK